MFIQALVRRRLCVALAVLGCGIAPGAELPSTYWPRFPAPARVLLTVPTSQMQGGSFGAEHFLAQSAAGLAARAVRDGTGETLIWINETHPDYQHWRELTLSRLNTVVEGPLATWTIVRRLRDQGIVQGYILYRRNTVNRSYYEEEPGGLPAGELSANVATSLCAVYDAVLIEESLASRAQSEGLTMLLDVRGKSQAWCLDTYRDRLNPTWLFIIDPKAPHMRDLCIATGSFMGYGRGAEMQAAHAWAEAGRPILGWNLGDEYKHTLMATETGKFNTASNWVLNVPVLSAVEALPQTVLNASASRVPPADDGRSAVAFLMSDGDNIGWLLGGFFDGVNTDYWGNARRGQFPFSWSACPADLEQAAPVVLERLARTQTERDDVVLAGGGYYYPDKMPPEILRAHARRLDALMERRNLRILGLLFAGNERVPYLTALALMAGEMTALDGIVTLRYAPYTGGNGSVDWLRTADGREIPAIAANWALWADLPYERNGTPEQIAAQINAWAQSNKDASADLAARSGLCVVHAWSYFEDPDRAGTTARGLLPVQWCVDRLSPDVRILTAHELCLRLVGSRSHITVE